MYIQFIKNDDLYFFLDFPFDQLKVKLQVGELGKKPVKPDKYILMYKLWDANLDGTGRFDVGYHELCGWFSEKPDYKEHNMRCEVLNNLPPEGKFHI